MEKTELLYACALNIILNYNCALALKLINSHPNLESIFKLSKDELAKIIGKDSSKYIDYFTDDEIFKKAEREIDWAIEHKIKIIFIKDKEYPSRLKECNDSPILLYYKGTGNLNSARAISIVGTRNATPYGQEYCRKIIQEFSKLKEKPIIISGLAYGIDICAHRAALEFGLETIAVISTGLDEIYPRNHRSDAIKIISNGGIITEYTRNNPAIPLNFIRRNRIIAGLCDACLVIESKKNGGSMITAKMAESYNRDIFALPGRLCDPFSQGPNFLIKQNFAGIIYSERSVNNSMGWLDKEINLPKFTNSSIFNNESTIKEKILVILGARLPLDISSIVNKCKSPVQDILLNLTELELDGIICKDILGRYYIK